MEKVINENDFKFIKTNSSDICTTTIGIATYINAIELLTENENKIKIAIESQKLYVENIRSDSDTRSTIWGNATETTMRLIIMRQRQMNRGVYSRIRDIDCRLNNDDKFMSTLNEYMKKYKNNTDSRINDVVDKEQKDIDFIKSKLSYLYLFNIVNSIILIILSLIVFTFS